MQFRAYASDLTNATTIRFQVEGKLNPYPLSEGYYNVTKRLTANSFVDWSPPTWTVRAQNYKDLFIVMIIISIGVNVFAIFENVFFYFIFFFLQAEHWSSNQKTPDLSQIIQELVAQPSWTTGTIIVIISRAPTDKTNNTRVASSGKDGIGAPTIAIAYSTTS
jgi:heme/copper-type cytochrome/quinol oxidase subunit 2